MAGNTGCPGGQYNNKNAEKWTEEVALALGKELIEWLLNDSSQQPTNLFFEEFLYIKQKLHPGTISFLSNKFKSFSKLLEVSKKIQGSHEPLLNCISDNSIP